nr:Uroporphyrinogen III decarboxylase [Raoultella sp. NCTC 9187]
MTELKNDRYLRALLRQPVDVTPVWMMRQGWPLFTGVQGHSRRSGRLYVAV